MRSNKRVSGLLVLGLLLIGVLLWTQRRRNFGPDERPQPALINVGWQRLWASQGQVMTALHRTNIPDLYDSALNLRDFQYGPDLNEAALTGDIAVTNSGIVPTMFLLAKSDDWVIIARQVDFIVGTVARSNSNVHQILDLRGRMFGVPLAGGSHPYALDRLQADGLHVGDGPFDVHVVNLQPAEQPIAMKRGAVDAVAVWEPTISRLIEDGGVLIDEDTYCGFVTVRKSFLAERRDDLIKFLKAYVEATFFTATHKGDTDLWFSKASGIRLDLVSKIKLVDRNFQAASIKEVDLRVDEPRMFKAQQVADVMERLRLIERHIQVKDRIDMSLYDQALSELRAEDYRRSREVEVRER